MKKVFLVHGFKGAPNASWFPWMMGKLKLEDIYASSLTMPNPDKPSKEQWVTEIERQVELSPDDEIYLVGYSLGSAAILNFLQATDQKVKGVVLVSGRYHKSDNPLIQEFYGSFDFEKIRSHADQFAVIHGENDDLVPVEDAHILGEKLNVQPLIIENGQHFQGSQGWREFPQCLEVLNKMF